MCPARPKSPATRAEWVRAGWNDSLGGLPVPTGHTKRRRLKHGNTTIKYSLAQVERVNYFSVGRNIIQPPMKQRGKKIAEGIVILGLSGLMLAASIKMFRRDIGLNLEETTKAKGQLKKAYTTTRQTGGQGLKSRTVFAFNMENVEQTLGAYRPSQDYSALMQKLQVGDTITVYYSPNASDAINIDVYQIEKSGEVVLDYDGYDKNHRFAAILCGIFGSIFLLIGIRQVVKQIQSS